MSSEYQKRNLSTREDVRKLYQWYIKTYRPDTHETVSFVRQKAADGTEFIDISDQLIPMDLKCVYFTWAILPVIQHDLVKLQRGD